MCTGVAGFLGAPQIVLVRVVLALRLLLRRRRGLVLYPEDERVNAL